MIEDLIDRHLSQPDPPELCPDCGTPIATCDCEKPEPDWSDWQAWEPEIDCHALQAFNGHNSL